MSSSLITGFKEVKGVQKICKKDNIAFYGLPEKGPILWVHIAKAFIPIEYLWEDQDISYLNQASDFIRRPTLSFEQSKCLLPIVPSESESAYEFCERKRQKHFKKQKNKDMRKRSRLSKRIKKLKYLEHSKNLFEDEKHDTFYEEYYQYYLECFG